MTDAPQVHWRAALTAVPASRLLKYFREAEKEAQEREHPGEFRRRYVAWEFWGVWYDPEDTLDIPPYVKRHGTFRLDDSEGVRLLISPNPTLAARILQDAGYTRFDVNWDAASAGELPEPFPGFPLDVVLPWRRESDEPQSANDRVAAQIGNIVLYPGYMYDHAKMMRALTLLRQVGERIAESLPRQVTPGDPRDLRPGQIGYSIDHDPDASMLTDAERLELLPRDDWTFDPPPMDCPICGEPLDANCPHLLLTAEVQSAELIDVLAKSDLFSTCRAIECLFHELTGDDFHFDLNVSDLEGPLRDLFEYTLFSDDDGCRSWLDEHFGLIYDEVEWSKAGDACTTTSCFHADPKQLRETLATVKDEGIRWLRAHDFTQYGEGGD
jgi:hypothetical protein